MTAYKSVIKLAVLLVLAFGFGNTAVAAKEKEKTDKQDIAPPVPVVLDGFPALQYNFDKDWSTSISFAEFKGEAALKLPVRHIRGTWIGSDDGFLYITPTRLAWEPAFGNKKDDEGFEINRSGGTSERRGKGFELKTGGREEWFMALFQHGEKRNWYPEGGRGLMGIAFPAAEDLNTVFTHWCATALSDFHDARQQFRVAVGDKIWESSPTVKAEQQLDEQAFQEQLAAWRAAGSKVELPEEVERHKVLAVAAFNDKDFQRAADEYMAGLKIYAMWPEGEFNVALLLGDSLGRYSGAVQHMNRYLELMPNAPNAEDAKHKLWIWQDRESRR